jgi:hypothetical protein
MMHTHPPSNTCRLAMADTAVAIYSYLKSADWTYDRIRLPAETGCALDQKGSQVLCAMHMAVDVSVQAPCELGPLQQLTP